MLRAVLFDFNGVILDDEPVHMMMFQRVLSEEGILLSQKEYYEHYLGMDDPGCLQTVYQAHHKKLSQQKLKTLVQKKSEYYDHYIKDHIQFFPKVVDRVKEAQAQYITAVVSGALRHEVEFGLKKAKLQFDVIVAQEETTYGKPHPEGYQLALDKINHYYHPHPPVCSAECLVVEDSLEGIHAAKEAGMKVAAVAHSYPMETLTQEADWVFETIQDLSLQTIVQHF